MGNFSAETINGTTGWRYIVKLVVGGSDFPDPIRRYTAGVSPRSRKLGKGLLEYRAGDGYPIPISIWGGGERRRVRPSVGEKMRGVGRPSVSPFENRIRIQYSGKSWQNGLPTERRRTRLEISIYRSIDLLADFSSKFWTTKSANKELEHPPSDALETRILLGNYRERYRVNRSRGCARTNFTCPSLDSREERGSIRLLSLFFFPPLFQLEIRR